MCDISFEENKAINTQLAMNIPLNGDVLSLIKSFVFEDKNIYIQKKLQNQRNDEVFQTIKSTIGYEAYEFEVEGGPVGYWTVWSPPSNERHNDLQLQSLSCLKCGKYINVSTWELESAIMDNKYLMCVNGEH